MDLLAMVMISMYRVGLMGVVILVMFLGKARDLCNIVMRPPFVGEY